MPRGSTHEYFPLARICFVSPGKLERITVRLTLLKRPMSSFPGGRTWEGREYRIFWDTAVAMQLYEDGGEFEKTFDKDNRIRSTPSIGRWMLVSLHQFETYKKPCMKYTGPT